MFCRLRLDHPFGSAQPAPGDRPLLPTRTWFYVHVVNKYARRCPHRRCRPVAVTGPVPCPPLQRPRRPPPRVMRRRRCRPSGGRPGPRAERLRVRPVDVDRDIQAMVDACSASSYQPVRHRSGTPCCSSPARTAPRPIRSTSRSATTPRSPASAASRRRHDQRLGRRPQPVRRQAVASRWTTSGARCRTSRSTSTNPTPVATQRRVLGGVAGRTDAPGARDRRQTDVDGLLHRARPTPAAASSPTRSSTGRSSTARSSSSSSRNSSLSGWSNGVWNQVFAGDNGAPAECFPATSSCGGPYTTVARTPVSREKPYLYVDGHGTWQVFVPSAQHDSVGTTWADGADPRPVRPAVAVLHREALGPRAGSRQPAQPRAQSAADARRLRHQPLAEGQARRHGRARPRLRDADRRPWRGADRGGRRPRRRPRRDDLRRGADQFPRAGRHRQRPPAPRVGIGIRIRPPCRTCSSASPARTPAGRPTALSSTATMWCSTTSGPGAPTTAPAWAGRRTPPTTA